MGVFASAGWIRNGFFKNKDGAWSASFSPNGQRIVTASFDNVQVWDAATAQNITTVETTIGLLGSAFSPNGEHIVTASYDKTVRIWDAATGP